MRIRALKYKAILASQDISTESLYMYRTNKTLSRQAGLCSHVNKTAKCNRAGKPGKSRSAQHGLCKQGLRVSSCLKDVVDQWRILFSKKSKFDKHGITNGVAMATSDAKFFQNLVLCHISLSLKAATFGMYYLNYIKKVFDG